MKFQVTDRVRWSDVDNAGIIYFGSYVRFFEIAETELFRSIGLPFSKAFDLLDLYPVRRQFHCDFHLPAYLDDLLTVNIWCDHIGNSSLRLAFEASREEPEHQLLMSGTCTLVTVDRQKYRPVRIPELLRSALAAYTEMMQS